MLEVLASNRDGYPLISGHRGGAAYAPENTMASFENGWERGADLLELDVQLTKDGHVVVFHDHTLDRTTDGLGPLGEKTLAEVQTLDAGSWFGPEFAGEKVPTFEEVVDWAKGKIRLNVELKSGPFPYFQDELAEKVVAILRKYDVLHETLIISFDHPLVRQCKILAPELACAINFTARVVDPIGLARVSKADILNMHRGWISPDLVALAHGHGLGVQCFCDGVEEAIMLTKMGVDFMDSDHHDVVRAAVRAVPLEEIAR